MFQPTKGMQVWPDYYIIFQYLTLRYIEISLIAKNGQSSRTI